MHKQQPTVFTDKFHQEELIKFEHTKLSKSIMAVDKFAIYGNDFIF